MLPSQNPGAVASRKYYAKNAAAIAASKQTNPIAHREASKKYYDEHSEAINAHKRAKRKAQKILREINGVLAIASQQYFTDLVAHLITLDTEEVEDILERIELLKQQSAEASARAVTIAEKRSRVFDLTGPSGDLLCRGQQAEEAADLFVRCLENIWDEVIVGDLEKNALLFSQLNWDTDGQIQV